MVVDCEHPHKERIEFDLEPKSGDVTITNRCLKCGDVEIEYYTNNIGEDLDFAD